MAKANGSKSFFKTYGFLIFMLTGIVAGCLVGAFAPNFGKKIEFLGTLFINMMFCVVVPMVFCSIASAIANMKSVKRAGKIMGVTIATFLVTAAIAGVIMYIVCRIFPLVDGHYTITEGEIGDTLGFGDMIVNFFTKPDFTELFSRRAVDEIFRMSCGIPRLINRICEKSLMYGCQQNLQVIDDQDVLYVSDHEMISGGDQL